MTIAKPPEDRATRYRRIAAQLQREAEALGRHQERAELLAIAEQYARLAERLARARPNTGRRTGRAAAPGEGAAG